MRTTRKIIKRLRAFAEYIRVEALGGSILIGSAILAMILANSGFHDLYHDFVHFKQGSFSVHFFINDILMAIFFLVVGLEIKREILEGEISSVKRAVLPGLAAVGGMVVPALVYVWLNQGGAVRGWAIPTATDIAFSLAILSLFGKAVPTSLKVFLTALAIIDDLLAVAAIALFYTAEVSPLYLGLAAATYGLLWGLNFFKVRNLWFYCLIGLPLFYFVYKSGIHATVAGVLLATSIPLRSSDEESDPPLVKLEHALHPFVSYFVLPVFAFANSGVSVSGFSLTALAHPVSMGSFWGLFAGKQIGVFALGFAAIKLKLAELPAGVTWLQFYGVAVLTGVGFTMSLFIGGLAFGGAAEAESAKVGVMAGSLASAVLAGLVFALGRRKA